MTISNDQELRNALDVLSLTQQRTLGIRFAQNVSAVTKNPTLLKALQVAITTDSADQREKTPIKLQNPLQSKPTPHVRQRR